jgi:hypothetical protein
MQGNCVVELRDPAMLDDGHCVLRFLIVLLALVKIHQ